MNSTFSSFCRICQCRCKGRFTRQLSTDTGKDLLAAAKTERKSTLKDWFKRQQAHQSVPSPHHKPPWSNSTTRWNGVGLNNANASFRYGGNTSAGMYMRCTTLNMDGDVTSTAGEYQKAELCAKYGIQARDLRKLDSGVPTVVPSILVRRSAVILSILHLRVVITASEVSLFDSVGSEDSFLKGVFIWQLQHALKAQGGRGKAKVNAQPAQSADGGPKSVGGEAVESATKTPRESVIAAPPPSVPPYEIRALEACLFSILSALENELTNLKTLVVDLLDGLESEIDRDKLGLLLQYSRKLTAFQKRAEAVQECLDEVLESDDDVRGMHLTAKQGGADLSALEAEDVELLLESFSKQCEEIVSEADNLAANVRHTEDIIELILDASRNALLALDLKVSIYTLGLTAGALLAGLFGMNLSISFEDHPFAFPAVSAISIALCGVITVFGLRHLYRARKVGLKLHSGKSGVPLSWKQKHRK